MARKDRSGDPDKLDLEEVGDWSGPDEDTTAQFWSGASLSRSDPKLREAIERLAAGGGEAGIRGRDEHTLPMETEGDEPTLAEAGGPGEDTDARARDFLLSSLGTGLSAARGTPRDAPRAAPPRAEDLDERTDPGLGPVQEFTFSIDPSVIAAAMAPRAEPPPRVEPPPRPPEPALDTLDGRALDPPDEEGAPSPATMALMFDGLDTGPVGAPVRDDGVDDLPSGAIPSFAEPPPGVPMEPPPRSPNPPTGPGRRVAARRPPPKPVAPPPKPPPAPAKSVAVPPRPASRPQARKRAEPPPKPKGSLEELLSLADAPPGHEDTISASLELLSVHDAPEREDIGLLSIADAPPEGEETIGGELQRVEPLLSLADAPPDGEHTLSADMMLLEEPSLSESLELLRAVPMPQDFLTGPTPRAAPAQPAQRPRAASYPPPPSAPSRPAPPPAPPVGDLETRDLGDLAGPKTVPLDPAQIEAAMQASAASQQRRVQQPAVSRAPRHQPQGTVSERMRRETYKPDATPAPETSRAISGTPRAARPEDLGPEVGDPYREPILAWAATLIGLVLLGGLGVTVLILLIAIL